MKKSAVVITFISLFSVPLFAGTKAHFFNLNTQAMIVIANNALEGGADPDAELLYSLMDVPPQNSLIGPGKAIVTSDKDFNLTCGVRNNKLTECNFIFKKSGRVDINGSNRSIVYEISGDEGRHLAQKFVKNQGDHFAFQNSDSTLNILAHSGGLVLKFAE